MNNETEPEKMSTIEITREEIRVFRNKLLEFGKLRKSLTKIGWRMHFINSAHQLDCLDAAMARGGVKKLSLTSKGKINVETEVNGNTESQEIQKDI